MWPFTKKTEKRSTEIDGYTNILLNAVESQADSDDSGLVRGVAALETAAGLWDGLLPLPLSSRLHPVHEP